MGGGGGGVNNGVLFITIFSYDQLLCRNIRLHLERFAEIVADDEVDHGIEE